LKKSLQRDNSSLKAKEKELIDNAKIKAREILENAKDEATSLIKEMKQIENTSGAISDLNTLRNKINLSIRQTSLNNSSSAFSENPISKEEIKPGLTVFASNLGQNATVLSRINKNDEVQVQIGAIKTNINIKYLEKAKKEANALKANSNPRVSKSKTVSSEINVIGLTVDEAIPLVDKFLDDCFLAKLETARIVHGKGTGKLRQGIHAFLKKQKRVKSFRIGTYGEGEMGVTIVELKI
jgi:DNA mismatch repair protein MutS2